MTEGMKIIKIEPTVFLKRQDEGLAQLIRLTISSPEAAGMAFVRIELDGRITESPLGELPAGECTKEVYIGELDKKCRAVFILSVNGCIHDIQAVEILPPRHWLVHVVQGSHHDPGYTDLPSRVFRHHDRWLDDAIDIARDTAGFDDDAKFRIVVEQAWSLDHFLKNTGEARAKEAIELIRQGRFEVTALFGNMTSELCGHEELARTLYHAFALKRRHGFEIVSAEHNDITGISWGLSTVLTEAGIKIFCPGLPLYYSWGGHHIPSFWDQKTIFGHDGPGAFWWEAPSGKRVLFWCNNSGCGGDCHGTMPGLPGRLQELEAGDYPYSVLRWPVSGARGDNSPYIGDYARTIQRWNEEWAYPHLVCSTNARFYADFIRQIPENLPVWRGEMAGQDYPVGATSTAGPTAANRGNHTALPAAETMASLATVNAGIPYPAEDLAESWEDVLWHDEHAWGFHFPSGPAARASEYEKHTHAWRAASVAHGVGRKALAAIADRVEKADGEYHIVVFNASQETRTGPVHAALREFDNACSTIYAVSPEKDEIQLGFLKWASLNDRWQAGPPIQAFAQGFCLSDTGSGENVPCQVLAVETPFDTVPYAAERLGLSQGTQRFGMFETPEGLALDLCFIARDVPAMGYRTYRLSQGNALDACPSGVSVDGLSIQNEYYRITADPETGSIASIWDKAAGRELVDSGCGHGFGTVVVREKKSTDCVKMECSAVRAKPEGPVCVCLEITASAPGLPGIVETVRLYAGVRQIHLEARALKDATPLQNSHIAFPFRLEHPKFRYEGGLSVMTPVADYLPGSQSDTIAVQNWVKAAEESISVLWASLDAPIASLGDLWPGYTSPAHSCWFGESSREPLRVEDMKKGWIYSELFSNNYGTNFAVSQVGDVLFRYVFRTTEGDADDAACAAFGRQAALPLEPIFTKRAPHGAALPSTQSIIRIDNTAVVLLTLKKAEDGRGYILRLWNVSESAQRAVIAVSGMKISSASLLNMAEEDAGQKLELEGEGFAVELGKCAVATVRIAAE